MFINTFNIHEEIKTKAIAQELSKISKKGDVFGVTGNMGSGKTTFIRHFIQRISKVKTVPSPSYNIILPYDSNKSKVYHMDAWRLKNYNEALSLGITEMFDDSIFLIEWAEKIKTILPNNYLKLSIKNIKNKKVLRLEGDKKWKIRLKQLLNYDKN
tara:strand:+ start:21901 stop:22368 length:468 start_codon:yes stop_codon:yes gene_type:complete